MNFDLFADEQPERRTEILAPGAVVMSGYVWDEADTLLNDIKRVSDSAPFRHLTTPGGYGMSVAMSNCGPLGWVSDERGYRYDTCDPLSGRPWPEMPPLFDQLATAAAEEAGFPRFQPDACLINRYSLGARLSLHQDKDERDLEQPIVSFSLGLNAIFFFGGRERSDPCQRVLLSHGDVVVWGGESRLFYHGIQPLKSGPLPSGMPGEYRFNMTFRKVR
ncbi:DNA oxidative demethylase AlkB [Lonsdalea quercina]|uniref:DNA oxidative demethylase AlkB n=1 Tax=Lonsdalea quercina TaxID=71657 RepID=UPI003974EC9E